jgi:hypothetical protein
LKILQQHPTTAAATIASKIEDSSTANPTKKKQFEEF